MQPCVMAFEMPSSCASLRRDEVGLPSIGGPLVTACGNLAPDRRVDDSGMNGINSDAVAFGCACHRNVGEVLSFPEARSTQCAIHRLVVLVNDNVLE